MCDQIPIEFACYNLDEQYTNVYFFSVVCPGLQKMDYIT